MQILKKTKFVVILVGVVLLTSVSVYAMTSLVLNDSIETTRYTLDSSDFLSGTVISQDTIEYELFTLAAGDQILSFVTNVKEAFSVPSDAGVKIGYIRAVQNGNIISRCNVARTVDLTYQNFERQGGEDCQEFGFYDENNPVDIILGIQTIDASDISLLESNGEADIIVTVAK